MPDMDPILGELFPTDWEADECGKTYLEFFQAHQEDTPKGIITIDLRWPMIENEKQYLVTEDRERQFAQLVKRMENGEDDCTPGEHPIIRQAKLDSTRSILQELREEIQAWESRTRTTADTRQPA